MASVRLPYRGSVTALRFSPDGNLLAAAASDATVRIFKAGLQPAEEPAIKLGGEPFALVFSPDGSMLAAIHKNGLSVRAFGRRMPPFDLAGDFRTVVFSPKGETLYAWEPARIRRFSTSGWKERKALPDHLPEEMRFSPDGRWLAVDYEVRSTTRRQVHRVKHVWDLTNAKVVAATGEEHAPDPSGVIRLLRESDSWERGVASGPVLSTPDGQWKADLNQYSKTVKLEHGDDLVAKLEHDGNLRALAFSPNGRWLATAATDQLIRLWPLQAADLIERACQILPHNLSEKEWKEARLEGGYRKTCPNLP